MPELSFVKPLVYVAFGIVVLAAIAFVTMFLECTALGRC
jgi:hypothetical protein